MRFTGKVMVMSWGMMKDQKFIRCTIGEIIGETDTSITVLRKNKVLIIAKECLLSVEEWKGK